jgi:hypothetical protein
METFISRPPICKTKKSGKGNVQFAVTVRKQIIATSSFWHVSIPFQNDKMLFNFWVCHSDVSEHESVQGVVAVALDLSFSSLRRFMVSASAGSSVPIQFSFFDCLTLKIKALRLFETSRTTISTHLEHSEICQETYIFISIIIFNLCTAAFKAYCAIWVRRSNFRHQASPRVYHARAPSGERWNCGRDMSGSFA